MKKKNLLLIILLVCVLSLSLTACAKDDFTGNAKVTIELDKAYEEIQISCPSAEITQLSDKKFVCKFNNTLPVEIIVGAKDKKHVTLAFTNEDLKRGDVVKQVNLEDAEYSIDFSIGDEETSTYEFNPVIIENNDIEIEKLSSNKFVLKSKARIQQDIIIDIGEEFYELVLPKEKITYTLGYVGSIKDPLTPYVKDGKSALVHSDMVINLVPKDNIGQGKVIEGKDYVEPKDYYLYAKNGYDEFFIKTIRKEELTVDKEYSISIQTFEIKNDVDIQYIEVYQKESTLTYKEHIENGIYMGSTRVLISRENIVVGDVLIVKINGEDYYYKVKEKDIVNGFFNFSNEDLNKYNSRSIDCKINLIDELGAPIDYRAEYMGIEYYRGDTISYNPGNYIYFYNKDGWESINYENFNSALKIMIAFNEYTEPVELTVRKVNQAENNVTIEFVDINTNKVINEKETFIYDSKLNLYEEDVPEGYTIMDEKVGFEYGSFNIPYDKSFYPTKTMQIKCSRYETVKLSIANLDQYPGIFENETEYFDCKNCHFYSVGVNRNETEFSISFLEEERGKSYVFEKRMYGYNETYSRVYFIVEIPKQGNDMITTSIVAIEDEWKEDIENMWQGGFY